MKEKTQKRKTVAIVLATAMLILLGIVFAIVFAEQDIGSLAASGNLEQSSLYN